jgi:protein-disulfide isomerase
MPVFLAISLLAALLAPNGTTPSVEAPPGVAIVVYSDFQCPYCAQLAPSLRRLQMESIDGIAPTIEFRNFPLSIHPGAQLAHQAAMAARLQGRFWEMHDLLFGHQDNAQRDDLIGYAKRLGLDAARFEKDLDSDAVKQMIAADVAEGTRLGVSGTPTYTINGRVYSGTRSFVELEELAVKEEARARAVAEIADDLMARGPSAAPVTLEVFIDLQSPVSTPAFDIVNQLLARYPTAVHVQFRNFPLAFHPQARLAHEAAMTGARDGRFWEFAAFALRHQNSLREPDLIAYAGELGLDQEKFADSIRRHRDAARVDADLQAGLGRGIKGSPVMFVNGARIDGVPALQTLVGYVEALVKVAR